jgi:hypothetical protein
MGTMVPGAAQAQTADEYQVKAAYMYNLAKFVDWPSQAFEGASQPIVFCVLGQTRLSRPLQDAVVGKVVGQRPLVFRQLTDSRLVGNCQVMFIASADKKQLRQTLADVRLLSVLTVGEAEYFLDEGGIVRFLLEEDRVRLEFNLDAADAAKLHISSKLLSLGRTVKRTGK